MLALRAGRPVSLRTQDPRPATLKLARRRLLLAGVALLGTPPAHAAAPGPQVHDDSGALLRLAVPARRIVALSPQLVELCFAAGAGPRLVGAVRGADQPAAARRLPRVGDAFGINLEALAMLRPDLILAWRSGTPPRQLAALRRLGIPVYWSETRRLRDIATTVLRIGTLAGTEATAGAWAAGYLRRLHALRAAQRGAPPVRVFWQVWPQPLMTIGGVQLIDRAIRLCGGVNVFGELSTTAPQVSREAVLQRDPQLIVAATPDTHALQGWKEFPQLSAVRHDRLVLLDPEGLPRMGAHTLDGVRQLCQAIDTTRRRLALAR